MKKDKEYLDVLKPNLERSYFDAEFCEKLSEDFVSKLYEEKITEEKNDEQATMNRKSEPLYSNKKSQPHLLSV